jgi:hypothetical protein
MEPSDLFSEFLAVLKRYRKVAPPKPASTSYVVKNPRPLPEGDFSICLPEREQKLGKNFDPEVSGLRKLRRAPFTFLQNKFIVPINADILFQAKDDDVDGRATGIGYIGGCIILLALMMNSGYAKEFL